MKNKFNIKINGNVYAIRIEDVKDDIAYITVNDVPYEVEVEGIATNPTRMKVSEIEAPKKKSGEPVVKPSETSSSSSYAFKSPLPGTILEIKASEGAAVKAGDLLLVLEAMKMENNIEADRDGIIETIKIKKGDSVLEGDVLLTIK
jgi:biotin carboxyl carrier protein